MDTQKWIEVIYSILDVNAKFTTYTNYDERRTEKGAQRK